MTKKQMTILAVASFLVGITLGLLMAPQNGKVIVIGSKNKIRTGYKSYDGNKNGNNNQKDATKSNKKIRR